VLVPEPVNIRERNLRCRMFYDSSPRRAHHGPKDCCSARGLYHAPWCRYRDAENPLKEGPMAEPVDDLLDGDGYPTDYALQRLADWPLLAEGTEVHDFMGFIVFAKSLWHLPEWGWSEVRDRDGGLHLYISTGGWSGNEDVLDAMEKNALFGLIFEGRQRGGHYHLMVPAHFMPGVAEPADASLSNSDGDTHEGSTPSPGTNLPTPVGQD
jgi:hypothetical protein